MHIVVDALCEMPAVRFQERDDRFEYDAFTTAELLGSQEGDDETLTGRRQAPKAASNLR